MAAFPQPRYRNDFEIAIICALRVESDAVEALFDEFWEDVDYGKAPGDTNAYTLGRISCHNIVLVHMPGMGKARAAAVAASFRSSFPRIKLCLLVGICGGVPNGTDNEREIVLGDVIISTGLVQYDFGRQFDHRFIRKDNLENNLGRPNAEIQSLLAKLGGRHSRLRLRKNTSSYLALLSQEGFENARYIGADEDKLFESTYRHKHHGLPTCNICANCLKKEDEVCDAALESSCVELKCDKNRQVTRSRLIWAKEAPAGVGESHAAAQENINAIKLSIHFGLMASGDTVIKSGEERDRIASKEKVIAFEMEGAGVWDTFPCVVIKGVSDYADSHKDKKWQGYAAATAAACMKAFLKEWITSDRPSQLLLPPISPNEETVKLNEQAATSKRLSHSKETILACLRTLSYSSIDDRKHNIALAHQDTCTWLFSTRTFQQWRNQDDLPSHNGVLWLKGKPGAGKSTLMKHTLFYSQENLKHCTIAAYFFNARGSDLEKTLVGMLRSLLYQLLERDPILCERFIQIYLDKVKKHGGKWEWSVGELRDFLIFETKSSRIKPFLLLVDALDECDELEVQKVVEFLEDLSISAVNARVTLYICLSSRHYPTIDMNSRLELKLEDQKQHDQDIITYVQNKLRVRDRKIEEELLRKADHVFLWVVLVVEMLNQAFNRGKMRALQQKLREVPSDLDGIFLTLLKKDDPGKQATLLILQWVLFAKRLLSPAELYFAVLAGTEPEELGPWNHQEQNDDVIKRYITDTSKGLIEVRQGETETVQFIHESVNDFLLRNKRLQTLEVALQQHPIGASHDRLVACCMAYIGMRDLDSYANEDLQAKIHENPYHSGYSNFGRMFIKQFPFLEYASMFVLSHAEMAQAGCISQQVYVQRLQLGNFQRLRIFHDALVHYSSEVYSEELIYAVSLDGHFELAKMVLQHPAAFVNVKGGYYGSALQAASSSRSKEVVGLLLEKGADVNLKCGKYGSALQAASWMGSKEVVRLLLDKGADVNLEGGEYGSALQAASYMGRKNVVGLLLDKGADVNLEGPEYGSALQAASYNGMTEVVRLLLDKGAEVNLECGFYGSALQAASCIGNKEVVELLLDKGADVNLEGGFYGSALQAASRNGDNEVVELLLNNGARVNAQGGKFGNALEAALVGGYEKTIALLREHGA